jgi:hypothetical protein
MICEVRIMERPVFEIVEGVGSDGMAKDRKGSMWLGIESLGESDSDWLGKCSICGEEVYIGWKRSGSKTLICFDCPIVLADADMMAPR